MHRPLVVYLVVFVFVSFSSVADAQESCAKQFVVSQVVLAATHLSRGEQAALRTRLIGSCFDDQQVSELAGKVRHTLVSFGYLQATVSEPTITIANADRYPQLVSVNVEFEEGARYKVREITWLGFRAVSSDQLMSVSQVQIEDVLDMSKVQATMEAVRKLYAANGYPRASIVPQVQSQKTGIGATVEFKISEGAQSR